MPTKHGNKVKIEVLLTEEQYSRLKAKASDEQRSVSAMAALIIDRETKPDK